MDDVVAVAVTFADGQVRYFLTYGRTFGPTAADEVTTAVLQSAASCGQGPPTTASLCRSLQEAAGAPYFFEALFELARNAVSPDARGYRSWLRKTGREMRDGRQIWYLGDDEATSR